LNVTEVSAVIDKVIGSRRSVRAFLPKSISNETISDILKIASRAPSGSNIQPWKVYVLQGGAKERLSSKVKKVFHDPALNALHRAEYIYYPKNWTEPFLSRRRKVGYELYGLLGIARGEHDKMHTQHAKNFDFFGAPVALVCTIHRELEQGSWLDYGMFIQNILIASEARGIQTCPQAAFISYHQIVAEELNLPANEQLVCCIAMGYEDTSAVENSLVTERAPVKEFVQFLKD
jgi:nitroreductase